MRRAHRHWHEVQRPCDRQPENVCQTGENHSSRHRRERDRQKREDGRGGGGRL